MIRHNYLIIVEGLFKKSGENIENQSQYNTNNQHTAKWKINSIQLPVAFIRKHANNVSLLNREREINELKVWVKQMNNNQLISSQNNFNKVLLLAHYLEAMQSIMEKGFVKNFLMVAKYPFSFNKIKLILALLLPKLLLKKIKNY